MSPRFDLEDLVTAGDIAKRLGISRQRVAQLVRDHDTFPAPIGKVGSSVVYRWRDVQRWDEKTERRPGRPRSRG
jgi:predicted DNA-binding transcriptional regulator AlpA